MEVGGVILLAAFYYSITMYPTPLGGWLDVRRKHRRRHGRRCLRARGRARKRRRGGGGQMKMNPSYFTGFRIRVVQVELNQKSRLKNRSKETGRTSLCLHYSGCRFSYFIDQFRIRTSLNLLRVEYQGYEPSVVESCRRHSSCEQIVVCTRGDIAHPLPNPSFHFSTSSKSPRPPPPRRAPHSLFSPLSAIRSALSLLRSLPKSCNRHK